MSIFGKKIDPAAKAPSAKPEASVNKKTAVKTVKADNGKKSVKAEAETKSMKDLYGATSATKVKDEKKGQAREAYGNAYRILVKPLVTEKVSNLGVLNKYVFAVAGDANKIEIAKAIKEIYGIKPISVNVIKMLGKNARYGKISGKRKDWKKAIITLPKDKTIKIYEGV